MSSKKPPFNNFGELVKPNSSYCSTHEPFMSGYSLHDAEIGEGDSLSNEDENLKYSNESKPSEPDSEVQPNKNLDQPQSQQSSSSSCGLLYYFEHTLVQPTSITNSTESGETVGNDDQSNSSSAPSSIEPEPAEKLSIPESSPFDEEKNFKREKLKAEAFIIDCDDADEGERLKLQQQQELENEMERKKRAIMMMSLRRKAQVEAKRAEKEAELARQRQEVALRREQNEQKKLEAKLKAEQILQQYRQKKLEREQEQNGSQNSNNSKANTNVHTTTNKHVPNSNFPHSHSAVNLSSHSHQNDNQNQNQHTIGKHSNLPPSISCYSGPKLFVKPTTKTNCTIIQNALTNVLGGAANAETLRKMLDLLEKSKQMCRHYLILFRDARLQFRALYAVQSHQTNNDELIKLGGNGPQIIIPDTMIDRYYKYDSPKRQFTQIHTKHLSLTIDAFTIHSQLWLTKRPATAAAGTSTTHPTTLSTITNSNSNANINHSHIPTSTSNSSVSMSASHISTLRTSTTNAHKALTRKNA